MSEVGPARQRILHAVRDALALGLPHERLVETGAGVLVAMGDADFLELIARAWPHRLVAWDRADWDRSIRELSAGDVLRVIDHRLDTFAPVVGAQALTFAMARVEATLPALCETPPAFATLLDFEARLACEGAVAGPADLLARAVEDLVALAAEETDGAEVTRQNARDLAGVLAREGRPAFSQALPYVAAPRVFWLPSPPPELVRALRGRQVALIPWEAGVVVAWPRADAASLGAGVVEVDPDPQCIDELFAKSAPERERDLAVLIDGATPERLRDRTRSLRARLRLSALLIARFLVTQARHAGEPTLHASIARHTPLLAADLAVPNAGVVRIALEGLALDLIVAAAEAEHARSPRTAAELRAGAALVRDLQNGR